MTLRTAGLAALLASAASLALAPTAAFADGTVNIYSARHYDIDEQLYSGFEKETGIKVNLIEGKEDELIERMKAEGANSPADIFVTADAGRLWRADQAGLLAAVDSAVLKERVPAHLRHPGPRHLLRQGQRHRAAADLCRSRRPEVQGPDLRALRLQHLHVVAARLAHRP
jgi:iron(III) transport system substrate-binding protein